MARIWNYDHPIPWICNEAGDEFRADIGKYHLQVIRKESQNWQWRVYHLDERIETRLNEFALNKHRAIGLAEGLYLAHELLYKDTEIRFFKSAI
jgi:hypothetical protein